MTAGLVTCCCERARIEHLQVPVQHWDSAGSLVVEATAPDWMLKVPGYSPGTAEDDLDSGEQIVGRVMQSESEAQMSWSAPRGA